MAVQQALGQPRAVAGRHSNRTGQPVFRGIGVIDQFGGMLLLHSVDDPVAEPLPHRACAVEGPKRPGVAIVAAKGGQQSANEYDRVGRFQGEHRLLVPSPKQVSTYDQKPEMSACEITEGVLNRLDSHHDDCLIINFANCDMVGHTGNLPATVRAVETVDQCVGRVVEAVIGMGGALIVTADHGNCEQMIDPATGGPHTAHTTFDVQLILVDERSRGRTLHHGGRLADIAPTLLEMLG